MISKIDQFSITLEKIKAKFDSPISLIPSAEWKIELKELASKLDEQLKEIISKENIDNDCK